MQVIALGMHRSGTSALARLLNLAGCEFGPPEMAMPAHADNPRGFWERQDVCELNDWALEAGGAAWDRPLAFEPTGLVEEIREEFEARAAAVVATFPRWRPWFLKDPRMCLLLPLWRPLFGSPVCVHIVRHPLEVASSLASRNHLPLEVGLALWELHVVRAAAAARDLPWVGVRHTALIDDPVETLAGVVASLRSVGVERIRMPRHRDVTDFITRDLHHHRWNRPWLADWFDCAQVRLFHALDAAPANPDAIPTTLSAESVSALAAYETSLRSAAPAVCS